MSGFLSLLPIIAGIVGTLCKDTASKVISTIISNVILKFAQTKRITPEENDFKVNMKIRVKVSIKNKK